VTEEKRTEEHKKIDASNSKDIINSSY